MAVSRGISNISGVPIASVSTRNGVAKANIWDVSGEQRQQSLFRSLTTGGAIANYAVGKNSASFSVVGTRSQLAYVFFPYASNDGRNTYVFNFTASGITRDGFSVGASTTADFSNIVGQSSAFTSGSQSLSVAVSDRTQAIYLGVIINGNAEPNAAISNLLVTIA
jgi:hypothetical protein